MLKWLALVVVTAAIAVGVTLMATRHHSDRCKNTRAFESHAFTAGC